MTTPPLEIDRHGDYVVARLGGDIDIANIEQVRTHMLDAVSRDAHGLVVDLTSVRYIDSAGIHMLFEIVRRLQSKRQGTAVVVPTDSPIATLLKITNLNEAAPVCSAVDEAAAALQADVGLY